MEKKFSEAGTGILQRITSPWFFTFIPWWVVFNYDFLLIVFGKIQVIYVINHHYCMTGSTRYTIAGCIPQISVGFWHWVFYTPWVTKLVLPIIATVFSMTVLAWCIGWISIVGESLVAQDFMWKKQKLYSLRKMYQDMYTENMRIYEFFINSAIKCTDRETTKYYNDNGIQFFKIANDYQKKSDSCLVELNSFENFKKSKKNENLSSSN